MADKIMLVDGNSLINRGFYAMPLLTNKDGEYTNGVFGFLKHIFSDFLTKFSLNTVLYALMYINLHSDTKCLANTRVLEKVCQKN